MTNDTFGQGEVFFLMARAALTCQRPARPCSVLSRNGVRAQSTVGRAARRWQPLAVIRWAAVRSWWRLLLLLRVPAPAQLRTGIWAPWRLSWWWLVRLAFYALRVLCVFGALIFLPWLLGALLSLLG